MKKHLLIACCFAAACLLRGIDAPTLDVFAGWGWPPFPYSYGYGPYWYDYPTVGLGSPLNHGVDYPYGYYGYAPFWGYGYGMRIHLKEKRYAPVLSANLLPPYPGSTPTDLRDLPREKLWDRDIETLLRTREKEKRLASSTNAPPLTVP